MARIVVEFEKGSDDDDECIFYEIYNSVDGDLIFDGCACEYDERDYMMQKIDDVLNSINAEEG